MAFPDKLGKLLLCDGTYQHQGSMPFGFKQEDFYMFLINLYKFYDPRDRAILTQRPVSKQTW